MAHAPFVFPEWLGELVPDDSLFAGAYQEVGDRNRALMKTGIARLYDWCGPRKNVSSELSLQWNSGFDSKQTSEPVDYAVILFDPSLLSPARLLAALVPALAGGVKSVLAARVGDGAPWRKAILTGLELAGQENVVDLTEGQARRLFTELRDSGRPGAVTVLGPKAAAINSTALQTASRISFWRPRFSRSAAIWMEDESSFDLDALAFIHPDIVFSVFGAETELPADNFSYEGTNFDDFLSAIMDVAYLPATMTDHGLRRAKLVLGPGQEACWAWSELHTGHFQFHSTSWTTGV